MKDLIKRDPNELDKLSDNALKYARQAKAKNTIRTYRMAWNEFTQFCQERGKPSLPADPATVADYVTALADKGAKVNTIDVKLAAIAFAHRSANVPNPCDFESVRLTMAGIRRAIGRNPVKKEPATLAEIELMVETLDTDTLKGKRDKALLLVGFAGAFRRSELVALQVEDCRINGTLRITIRKSKTDQEGEGRLKTIPAIGGNLCPVAALQDWLDTAEITSGPVFRRMDRHGNLYPDPITAQVVSHVVKQTAQVAGLDYRNFSGHSLRSGFITQAFNAGANGFDIMEQTHHSNPKTLAGYRKNTGIGASRAVLAAFEEIEKGENDVTD
jgi:site-specific recombinase XerD